ncbi:NIPSNAP family protein [Enterovibrio makurazakiensis]|uniref:NIPSNAP family protein n=1 Tax=Enterovibrio makurazakiensis TaxID=2910232 RepID=UPI003D1A6A6E
MVTCYLRYVIDPAKTAEFEQYAKMWIPLVNKFGGKHNGYFLPSEGANNIALALFTFKSLAEYEAYRKKSFDDDDCKAAFQFAQETNCIVSYERSFFRPVFE